MCVCVLGGRDEGVLLKLDFYPFLFPFKSSDGAEVNMSNFVRRFLAWDGCLLVCSVVGVGVGFSAGFAFYHAKASPTTLLWIGKLCILPLTFPLISAHFCRVAPELQALVYDILPPTTAITDYAIGPEKLSANGQFFVGAEIVLSL